MLATAGERVANGVCVSSYSERMRRVNASMCRCESEYFQGRAFHCSAFFALSCPGVQEWRTKAGAGRLPRREEGRRVDGVSMAECKGGGPCVVINGIKEERRTCEATEGSGSGQGCRGIVATGRVEVDGNESVEWSRLKQLLSE